MKSLWIVSFVLGLSFSALQIFWPDDGGHGVGFIFFALLFFAYCAYRWRIGLQLFRRGPNARF